MLSISTVKLSIHNLRRPDKAELVELSGEGAWLAAFTFNVSLRLHDRSLVPPRALAGELRSTDQPFIVPRK